MSELVAALIGGGAAIIVSIFGARDWLTRRSSKEANSTASWTALTGALQSDLTRLRGDVAILREDLDQVKLDLNHERHERQSLATVLRSAWTHILRLGEQITALNGRPEPPPADLAAWMQRDGLIVDRVETTISRTTVTDTRTPDEAPLEVEDSRCDGDS